MERDEEMEIYVLENEMEQQLQEMKECLEKSRYWWTGSAGDRQRAWMEELFLEVHEYKKR